MQTLRSIAFALIFFAAFWGVAVPVEVHAAAGDLPTLGQLSRPPLDTLDAERIRIWLPINRTNPCLVTIDIINDSGGVARRLVDQLLPGGYYNLYWDKKGDSGEYVPPGEYRYRVRDCGKLSGGELLVQYTDWERSLRLIPNTDSVSGGIIFELTRDSAWVSAKVLNKRGRLIDEPMTDSLMQAGRHVFEWVPPQPGYVGDFLLHLTVGDYTHEIEISLARQPR